MTDKPKQMKLTLYLKPELPEDVLLQELFKLSKKHRRSGGSALMLDMIYSGLHFLDLDKQPPSIRELILQIRRATPQYNQSGAAAPSSAAAPAPVREEASAPAAPAPEVKHEAPARHESHTASHNEDEVYRPRHEGEASASQGAPRQRKPVIKGF